jgi:ATP-dependent 26S proteasome regulatory subunit
MIASVERTASGDIAESLRILDEKLRRMVEAVRIQTGREPGADRFRGLYVSEADVVQSLDSGDLPFDCAPLMAAGAQFAALGRAWNLDGFELDVLLIALAPEVDLRYQRIFGYLQDDVSRKWPTVDLILNLLCHSVADKFEKRTLLSASSPLARHRLIRLSGDELTATPQREVSPDPGIAAFLLGEPGSVPRFTTLAGPDRSGKPADPGLVKLARTARMHGEQLVLYFQGESEDSKRTAAIALAAELGVPLVVADMQRAARAGGDFEAWLGQLSREAILHQAIVYRESVDRIATPEAQDAALRGLLPGEGIAIFSGTRAWQADGSPLSGAITIRFELPEWAARRGAWKAAIRAHGARIGGQALDSLAECFRFDNAQVEDAVRTAGNIARYRNQPVRAEHIFEAARSRSGHELASLTRKITPAHNWKDIVLPEDASAQLREICQRVTLRHQVFGKWGFGRKLSSGRGVNALFHGHSGTGKTMAAEVIASELQLDLYKIDLAGVVSKYIGETEKNLDRIFAAAETANAILFFDEADALFGKRSEVRDSHDRYANLEISYLLQKMEQYEGVAILATNLRQNLDDAFLRRLAFSVTFPFPDENGRRRIWEGIWPEETPLAADLDREWLASRFLLSGGNIRNVALAAAYLAIEESGANGHLEMSHVLRAVRAEFQKLGKTLTEAEVTPPTKPAWARAVA